MKAVADLVNLSIASLYVAMVGVGCVILLFPHCFTPLCARARNIISSLAENGQTQRKYHCPRDIQILKTFKHFNGDGGRCVRGASRTSQRRGPIVRWRPPY